MREIRVAIGEMEPRGRRLTKTYPTTTTDFIQQRMLGALIQPDELVAAAIFLAGDGAAKVTGHTLAVDDGYLAQ